ncbi:MAG: hypothetical protein Tsb0033_15080 [Winogradskyella sp.]
MRFFYTILKGFRQYVVVIDKRHKKQKFMQIIYVNLRTSEAMQPFYFERKKPT